MNGRWIALGMFATLSVVACGGRSTDSPAPSAATTAPAAAPAEQAPTAAPVTVDVQFGVPECDDYIRKYTECIGRMPTAAQTQAQYTIDQTKKQWQQAASTEQGKASLAAGCKAATDAARTGMQGFGCTF